METKPREFAYKNAFIARGIVRDFGTTTYGSYLVLFIKERRSEITFRISLPQRMLKYIGRNDRVVVKGYTRSFDHHNTALNRDRHLTFFEALSVEKDIPVLGSLFDDPDIGFFCPEPVYMNAFAGEVIKYETFNPNGDWADVTIKTCCGGEDKRLSFPVLRFKRKDIRGHRRDLKVGDQIQCYCTAWTPEREFKGEKVYAHQMIIEDYNIFNRPEKDERSQPADVISAFPVDLNPLVTPRRETKTERIQREARDIFENEGFNEQGAKSVPAEASEPVADAASEPPMETADDSALFLS